MHCSHFLSDMVVLLCLILMTSFLAEGFPVAGDNQRVGGGQICGRRLLRRLKRSCPLVTNRIAPKLPNETCCSTKSCSRKRIRVDCIKWFNYFQDLSVLSTSPSSSSSSFSSHPGALYPAKVREEQKESDNNNGETNDSDAVTDSNTYGVKDLAVFTRNKRNKSLHLLRKPKMLSPTGQLHRLTRALRTLIRHLKKRREKQSAKVSLYLIVADDPVANQSKRFVKSDSLDLSRLNNYVPTPRKQLDNQPQGGLQSAKSSALSGSSSRPMAATSPGFDFVPSKTNVVYISRHRRRLKRQLRSERSSAFTNQEMIATNRTIDFVIPKSRSSSGGGSFLSR